MSILEQYAPIVGDDVINQLQQLAKPLQGKSVVHVNSTKLGGGVAEILTKLVPLMQELGLHTDWQVINGDEPFFQCTKAMHNALQGNPVSIPERLLSHYEDINRDNAERLRSHLSDADFVFIHDPQPAPQLSLCPNRRGHWIWRCHIDASRPYRPVWKFLRPFIEPYQASIFPYRPLPRPYPIPNTSFPPASTPSATKMCRCPRRRCCVSSTNLLSTRLGP